MRAIRVHVQGNERSLRMEEMPSPSPRAGQVLVRVSAFSVNHADLLGGGRTGDTAAEPFVPGLDVGGVVEAVGEGVAGWRPGDPVMALVRGAYAELALARPVTTYRPPAGMSLTDAAAVPGVFFTAWYGLTKWGRLKPGETALKWVGIGLGSVVGLIVVAVIVVYFIGGAKLNKTYDIQPAAVAVPTNDPAAIQRGKHMVEAFVLCSECHGENLAGEVLEDDPVFGRFAPANLTTGRGGIGPEFSDLDFVRAIRHGVNAEGKAIPIMPSKYYNVLSDADVGAIIAYVRSVPPVDNEVPPSRLRVLGRVLYVLGVLEGFFEVEAIDHDAARPPPPEPGVTVAYGKYMATICTACHGADLVGGPIPQEPSIVAPNITSAGGPGRWVRAGVHRHVADRRHAGGQADGQREYALASDGEAH